MNTAKFIMGILCLALLCNCSNSEIEEQIASQCSKRATSDIGMTRYSLEVPDSTAYPYTIEEDKILLAQLGFDTTYVQEFDTYYRINESRGIQKEALRIYREQPATRISVRKNLPIESQHIYLYCYYDDYDVTQLILNAIDEWNNIENCNIHFYTNLRPGDSYLACNTYLYVKNQPISYIQNTLEYVDYWMITGAPNMVAIDTQHQKWGLLSDTQKKYFIMHALGHVVGLDDITDEWDYLWDPTIMKSHTFISESNTEVWSGFSENDIAQLQQLYPIPTTEFSYEWSGSDSNNLLVCPTNNTISVNVTQSGGNHVDYTLEYTVDADESDYTVGEWGNTLEFQFLEAGTYTVTITPIAGEETFAGETFEIEVYDIPEISYSWSPALTNEENKFQINESYRLTIEGLAPEFDLTVTIAAETSGDQYTCTKINDREHQITFEDLGAYDITLKVKRCTRTLITETIEVTVVDEPTFDFSWSPIPKNTKNKLLKGETYSLAISGLGNQYTVGLEVTPDTVEMEYDLTATSNRNFELTLNDTGKYNLAINVFNGEQLAVSKTIEVTAIDAPSLNPAWSSPTEIGEYFSLNTNYTLNLNYVNEYYNNSNGFTYDYMVKYKRIDDNVLVDRTSTVLISKTGQQALFNFNLPGEYLITASIKYGSALVDTYETTCRVVGGRIVMNNGDDEAILNIPYSFIYYYWHPEHQNVTYEFKLSEELFDMGSANNIIYDQDRENSFMVSFRDYGCYYIEAIVKDGYTVCDRKIVNFTKLYRLDPCVFELYEIKANPNTGQEVSTLFKYKLHLGTESNITERFYGEAQRVKEVRRAFYIGKERRVEREFTHYIHPILLPKESQTTLVLSDGGFGRTITPFDSYEVYYTYNGYIYYPEDRVGLANSTNPEDLPREGVKYEVINTSGVMGIDL